MRPLWRKATVCGLVLALALTGLFVFSFRIGVALAQQAVELTTRAGAAAGTLASRPPVVFCQQSAIYDASTNGATQLVALVAGQSVRVCGFDLFAAGTASVSLVSGTGTNCGTGQAQVTPAFQLTTQTGIVDPGRTVRGLNGPAGAALCLLTSAGVAVQAIEHFSQY